MKTAEYSPGADGSLAVSLGQGGHVGAERLETASWQRHPAGSRPGFPAASARDRC